MGPPSPGLNPNKINQVAHATNFFSLAKLKEVYKISPTVMQNTQLISAVAIKGKQNRARSVG